MVAPGVGHAQQPRPPPAGIESRSHLNAEKKINPRGVFNPLIEQGDLACLRALLKVKHDAGIPEKQYFLEALKSYFLGGLKLSVWEESMDLDIKPSWHRSLFSTSLAKPWNS